MLIPSSCLDSQVKYLQAELVFNLRNQLVPFKASEYIVQHHLLGQLVTLHVKKFNHLMYLRVYVFPSHHDSGLHVGKHNLLLATTLVKVSLINIWETKN